MSLLPFFQWCYQTAIGETIRESTWLFPLIEAFHLIGLGLTAVARLGVDLTPLGVGPSPQAAAQPPAARDAAVPCGILIWLASGIPLLLSAPPKSSRASR